MYLNEEAKEMLIDYILEQDKSKILDLKYAGFEGIVIALVNEKEVTFARSTDEIENYLCEFDFVDYVGYDINGTDTVTIRINFEPITTHSGFMSYVEEMKVDAEREIKQLERDADELRTKLGRMSTLVKI